MSEPETNVAVPDYDTECDICGNTPVVVIKDASDNVVHELGMCGACTWGEAACIDPDNW